MLTNIKISRAAISWTAAFPEVKEVNKHTASVCRTAMSLARHKNCEPVETFEQACRIHATEKDELINYLDRKFEGVCR